ncbi:MAG: hypothetical protein ACQEQS_09785 [Thermodesulfobacteriota bacterium]
MSVKAAERMSPVEEFLYECHLKEVEEEFCEMNMPPESFIIDEEFGSDFDMLAFEAERLAGN